MHIRLIEIYRSIQGETSLSGLPTTFIRTASCNLRCSWCDTPYSFGRGEPWPIERIVERAKELGCPRLCLTGGEPLLQREAPLLIQTLCNEGFQLSIETGGSLDTSSVDPRASLVLDVKCPGSGMESHNHWLNLERLKRGDQVKFVLLDRADYDYAKAVCSRHGLFDKEAELLLSPVHGRLDPKELVCWMLEDRLKARLNLQIHKYIWDERTKGV